MRKKCLPNLKTNLINTTIRLYPLTNFFPAFVFFFFYKETSSYSYVLYKKPFLHALFYGGELFVMEVYLYWFCMLTFLCWLKSWVLLWLSFFSLFICKTGISKNNCNLFCLSWIYLYLLNKSQWINALF